MFDLPTEFDEKDLIGHVLEMVCVGPFFTRLEFSKPSATTDSNQSFYVGIKGSISLSFNGANIQAQAENPESMAQVIKFLRLEILSVRRCGHASLELQFELQKAIVLNGEDSPDFEAYSIQVFGKDTVLV